MKLAEKCNTSTSYIGEIEIGRKFPSIEMIESICHALEVKPYQLFLEENDYIKKISPERTDKLTKNLQTIIEKTIRESDI
jgi:transcriptional regulator with XRE-family HTH domain